MNEIATKKRTSEILEKYDLQPKKRFGQNFIVEPGVVRKIADAIAARNPDTIVEIGPGIGALSDQLVKHGSVLAFEVDPRFEVVLQNEIEPQENLKVIQKDFLEVDVDELLDGLDGTIAFASNLPYYITTPILFKLFEATKPIDSITTMMQKEVADRFLAHASGKDYNALSVIVQYLCNVKKIMDVNRNVFWPSPNVDSTVLQFTFKKDRPFSPERQKAFFAFVKQAFEQRRKTLYNNLSSLFENREQAEAFFEKAGIPANMRAQQLSLEQFEHLFEVFESVPHA